jgi:hypothetical protein
MAKRDITMTPAEVDAFLARCPQMVVGAIGADGWPVGTIAEASYESGALAVRLDPGDPVSAQLARDPRVCCLYDEHESYFEIRGVIVHGRLPGAVGHGAEVEIDGVISFDFGRLK